MSKHVDARSVQEERIHGGAPASVTTQGAPSSSAPSATESSPQKKPRLEQLTYSQSQSDESGLLAGIEMAAATYIHPISPAHSLELDKLNVGHQDITMIDSSTRTPSPAQTGCAGDQPCVITPSTTAPSSDRAVSPITFDKFPSRGKSAKDAHYKRAQIYSKSREMVYHKTNQLAIIASRGFQRGYLPTKRTKPPLLRRRYSIDVLPYGRDHFRRHRLEQQYTENDPRKETCHQTDPYILPAPVIMLPNASRYVGLGTRLALNPPLNSDIYLELGDAIIRNDAFLFIGVTDHSWDLEVWMRDESINMALEVLGRDTNCNAHAIGIVSSNISQICHFVSTVHDEASAEYNEYRERFRNKRWIFMVINDAMGSASTEGTIGTHWSLVVIDRYHRRVHYFDSLWIGSEFYQTLAFTTAHGMLRILGDVDTRQYDWLVEFHSPHQKHDNQGLDSGACGPFVLRMTEYLIEHIKQMQRHGREDYTCFSLDSNFPLYFRSIFDSQQVRFSTQCNIARWKAFIDAPRLVDEHDQAAIRDDDVALLGDPAIAESILAKVGHPTQRETSQRSRYSSCRTRTRTPSPSFRDSDIITIVDSDDDSQILHASDRESDLETQPPEDIMLDQVEYNWVRREENEDQDLIDLTQDDVASDDADGLVEELPSAESLGPHTNEPEDFSDDGEELL